MDRCGWHGDIADFPNASEENMSLKMELSKMESCLRLLV